MARQPKTIDSIAAAPFFADGHADDLIDEARECFAAYNLRRYSQIVWQLRTLGMRECERLNSVAANELMATATGDDHGKADHYAQLTGKARKRYGARHSAALTRAGVRAGSSLPNVGAKNVWGVMPRS